MRSTLVIVVLVLCAISFVLADEDSGTLRCYTCYNIKVDSSSSIFGKLVNGQSAPWCDKPSISDNTELCPSSTNYMCGYFEGSLSGSIPIVGTTTATVQKRGCVQVDSNAGVNTCRKIGSDDEREFLGDVLSGLSEMADITVDGKMCVCGTDYCDANCDGVAIGPYCLSLPLAIILGIGSSLLTLFLITCCCCCCCCACCKTRRPGFVVNSGLPSVTMITVPQGAGSTMMVPPPGPPYHRLEEPSAYK